MRANTSSSPDRLCNIVDATNLERFHLVLIGFERTEKDDGYGTSRLIGLKTSTYLVTVHTRHPDIQQNQRRRLNLRAAEGQFPIGSQPHPVTLFPQYFLQQSKVGRFIVDHENLIHVSITALTKLSLLATGLASPETPHLAAYLRSPRRGSVAAIAARKCHTQRLYRRKCIGRSPRRRPAFLVLTDRVFR